MKKSKVQELYEGDKSKGFVNHLIRSYLPINKVEKIWEFKKGQKPKCNVCSQALMSVEDAFQDMQKNKDKMMKDFMQNLKDDVNNKPVKHEDRAMVKHIAKGRVLGFTGQKTDTCLCNQCVSDLLELTQNGLLFGDRNITYQMNQMRRDSVFNHFLSSDAIDEGKKEEIKTMQKRVNKKKTATLGDLEVLQKLKEDMEKKK